MSILRHAGSAVAALAAITFLAACSDVEPTAVPEAGAVSATTTTSSTAPSTTTPRTTTPTTGAAVDLDVDVEIGDCVRLGGTVDDATIANAICGTDDANYKVVDVVEGRDACISDVDQTYYETFRGIEAGALCLDIDWMLGDCFDLGGEDPQRIDCDATAIQGERVSEILTGTTDVNDCSTSDGGFVYRDRDFVVCTDSF
ncbi:LppU family putative lipoprotein [Rhodococcus yananensis]|uniref:LppU family putative lipoprotein n=1 Tax=Rhodococcus yananensis TaxID=2879464 RepID=UPI003EBD723B